MLGLGVACQSKALSNKGFGKRNAERINVRSQGSSSTIQDFGRHIVQGPKCDFLCLCRSVHLFGPGNTEVQNFDFAVGGNANIRGFDVSV